MTDEEKEQRRARYRRLINSIYGIINDINDKKKSVSDLDNITEEGLRINELNPEKDDVASASKAMDTTISNLYSAISSMRSNMD